MSTKLYSTTSLPYIYCIDRKLRRWRPLNLPARSLWWRCSWATYNWTMHGIMWCALTQKVEFHLVIAFLTISLSWTGLCWSWPFQSAGLSVLSNPCGDHRRWMIHRCLQSVCKDNTKAWHWFLSFDGGTNLVPEHTQHASHSTRHRKISPRTETWGYWLVWIDEVVAELRKNNHKSLVRAPAPQQIFPWPIGFQSETWTPLKARNARYSKHSPVKQSISFTIQNFGKA